MFERVDENTTEAPGAGQWRITWAGPRIQPQIGCPMCAAVLSARRVNPFGEVDGAVHCHACPWWGYCDLDQWKEIRAVYGARVTDMSEPLNAAPPLKRAA